MGLHNSDQTRDKSNSAGKSTFFTGMIQAFDSGGLMYEPHHYEDDMAALLNDWCVVGNDFWCSIVHFDNENACGMLPSLKFNRYVTARD